MTPYFVVFALLMASSIGSELTNSIKNRRFLGGLSALTIIIFFGFRWETGTDWPSYNQLFVDLSDMPSITYYLDRGFEAGFLQATKLITIFTNSIIVYNLIFTLLAFGILYFAFSGIVTNISLSFLSVYCSFGLINFMGSIRRGLSISLVLLALSITFSTAKYFKSPNFNYLKQTQRIQQYFYLLVASFFHRSAIASVIAFLVPSRIQIKGINLVLSFAFVSVLGFIISEKLYELIPFAAALVVDTPLANKLGFYTGEGYVAEGYDSNFFLIASIAKRFLVICFAAFSLDSFSKQPSYCYNSTWSYEVVYFIVVYLLGLLGYIFFSSIPTFQIMTVPYAMSECFLLPLLLLPFKKLHRIILVVFISIFLLFQLISSINVLPEVFVPYKSILY